MSLLIKRLKRRLRLWKPAGRNLTILHDDAFLVSYPRSGNTWMRFLLGQARLGRTLHFVSIESVIPDIYQNSDRELLSVVRPRVLKSHEMYTDRYPRVIYIVRDPRDVAISFYYWHKKMGTYEKKEVYLSLIEYLRDHFCEKELALGVWAEHVGSWMNHASSLGDSLFLIRYEDIEQAPRKALQRAIGFLGWGDISDSAIDFAVKQSEAERMRKAEKALPGVEKEEIPFVRNARSGQWREVFDDRLNEVYWERFGKWMERFGYDRL